MIIYCNFIEDFFTDFFSHAPDKLFFLRTNQQEIISSRGYIGHKPILIIYNDENIHTVIEQYIELLIRQQ